MTTLRELQHEDIVTDYALTYVADDLQSANDARARLTSLDVVSDVKTPTDYLPQHQAENLFILEDARFLLDSLFAPQASRNRGATPNACICSKTLKPDCNPG